MDTLILTKNPQVHNNQITMEWLQSKINLYESEVMRLERELIHARASLKGHQIWLEEVKQREGAK